MKIEEILEKGVEFLKNSGIDRARLEAEILLGFVLKYTRVQLHCHYHQEVEAFFVESFMRLIKRRSLHEPIEYLIESVSFFDTEFYISHGALIPRPETEILLQKALDVILENPVTNIAEIGVGSGVISVLLAYLTKKVARQNPLRFYASDIAPEALFNAYVNKVRFKADNLELFNSAYLDFNQQLKIKFDVLISNPPYIKNGFTLPKSLSFEPQNALFGGEKGDEMLLHIIDLAYTLGIPFLLCEMGYDQKESVLRHLQKYPYKHLEFYEDLAGLDRGFVLKF